MLGELACCLAGALLLLLGYLLAPLLRPRVCSWPASAAALGREESGRPAVYAGSMNPAHAGHLALVGRIAALHPKLYLVIGFNPGKKYPVQPAHRAELLRQMVAAAGLTNVEVCQVTGYVWRFALARGAGVLYRGIRSWAKDGAEERRLHALNQLGPALLAGRWPLPTVFLEGDPRCAHISSTEIRERAARCDEPGAQRELAGLLPGGFEQAVWRLYH